MHDVDDSHGRLAYPVWGGIVSIHRLSVITGCFLFCRLSFGFGKKKDILVLYNRNSQK